MFSFSSALTQAVLIKRYKRFLADVILPSGETTTVHCPNTGAMTGCCDPHSTVYLSESTNPKRKYKYTWEYAVDPSGHKICINTNNANKVVKSALERHHILQVGQYGTIIPEQKYNDSRIDFLLQEDGHPDCYLEVKSVTLAANSLAMFPDTVTKRGQKHCYELANLSKQGFQAKLLFCVMRESITQFKIADSIDPDYAVSVEFAAAQGVEILCYACVLSETNISLSHQIPIIS
ncbi:MAG: sugar fermentation stimulation protein A [Patiriisocius sp.]|jgi:sugar fermentation stimulation protein A